MPITEKISQSQSSGYFWNLLNMNILPIVVWKNTGEIICANDVFYDLLGYDREEFESGKVTWKSITPTGEGYEELDQQCIEQLETDNFAEPFDKVYISKDGSLVPVRLFNSVNEPGDVQGIGIVLPM